MTRLLLRVERPDLGMWVLVACVAILELVFPAEPTAWLNLLQDCLNMFLLGLILLGVAGGVLAGAPGFMARHGADVLCAVAGMGALALGEVRGAGLVALLRFLGVGVAQFLRTPRGARMLNALLARPAMAMVASFSGLILLGSMLLATPAALANHHLDTPLVALFTATSATCVTGLSVVDIGQHYSRFGQWVILALIQVGGLGLITLTSAMALVLRRGLGKRVTGAVAELMETETHQQLRTLLFGVVVGTGVVELLGTAWLYPLMDRGPTGALLAPADRAFYALFHSVSAYCNAGFSLYPDSLARFVSDGPLNVGIMALIIIGGLGGPVMLELVGMRWLGHGPRLAWRFLSVHTKVALSTTAVLLVLGTWVFLVLERFGSQRDVPLGTWFLTGMFQSTSLRTAGFSTVDFSTLSRSTLLVSMALMLIGGCPAGTAGGIKTTTAAVIFIAVRAMLRGRPQLEVFDRALPPTQVYRALTVLGLSLALLMGLTLVLLMVESQTDLLPLLFEAVSAFSTTGHSMGLTALISAPGQLVLVAMMFAGRLGPFTLALAVGTRGRSAPVQYPEGRILVG